MTVCIKMGISIRPAAKYKKEEIHMGLGARFVCTSNLCRLVAGILESLQVSFTFLRLPPPPLRFPTS